jgi:threonine/homoserine/homoserine lactone efflux protein
MYVIRYKEEIAMPAPSAIALFLLAASGLLLIPGPSVLYIITCSIAQGKRAGLASVLGIELASLVHVIAAALGLSALLLTSALAFSIVKYLGAGYLIYLGLCTLLRRETNHQPHMPEPKSFAQLFANGFLVNLLNPKTALFFYALLPQFVVPARGTVAEQILLLGGMFVLLASCTDSLYALLSSTVGRLIFRKAHIQRFQQYITGSIYIVLGVVTAISSSEKK